jgi:hypothetical protein
MCKYCEISEGIKNEINTLEFADGTIVDKSVLCVSIAVSTKDNKSKLFVDANATTENIMFTFGINYCPMCGRELNNGTSNKE